MKRTEVVRTVPQTPFGQRLKAALEAEKLSQGALERSLNLGRGTISKLITGERRNIEADTLFRIAKRLHTSAEELYEGHRLEATASIEQPWEAAGQAARHLGCPGEVIAAVLSAHTDPAYSDRSREWWFEQYKSEWDEQRRITEGSGTRVKLLPPKPVDEPAKKKKR